MRLILPPPRPSDAPELPPAPPAPPSCGSGARVWLVRHARVADAFQDLAYGADDVPLSPEGEEETRRLARSFATEAVRVVHASDLSRASTMGRAIAEATGAPLVVDPALREIERGAWTGISKREFHARWEAQAREYWRDPWNWRVPGGDSDASLFARAWPAVMRALRAAEGGTAVVAAHANLIRVVLGRALGKAVAESYALESRPAHASLLVDARDGWRLEAFDVGADRGGAPARG